MKGVCKLPEYIFTAKDKSGRSNNGVLEAENLDFFYKLMKDRGLFCMSVKEGSGAGSKQVSINLSEKKVKIKELTVFCRQFSTMLSSGITVIKCLDILYQQTESKNMKAKILGIYEAVQKGESLSHAMRSQKNAFPFLLLNMVEAGEASGSLDVVMQRMADNYEKDNKLQNKVKQAMIYPLILSGLTVLVVIFLLTFVLPRFTSMFAQLGGKLPLPTRILLGLSGFIISYWYVIILVVVLIVVVWHLYLKSKDGRISWDKFKLKFPVIGKLLLIVESARFSRTLSSLISSGMPIIQALEIVGRVITNRFMEQKLLFVIEDVRRGLALSYSMKKLKMFPPMLCSMISVGEESGNLDDILNKTAGFYDEESDAAIARLLALIEPVMIVILALVVGFIVISIITPIFAIYQNMNAGNMQ
jgi:type IV pilus assembly protein PilC